MFKIGDRIRRIIDVDRLNNYMHEHNYIEESKEIDELSIFVVKSTEMGLHISYNSVNIGGVWDEENFEKCPKLIRLKKITFSKYKKGEGYV